MNMAGLSSGLTYIKEDILTCPSITALTLLMTDNRKRCCISYIVSHLMTRRLLLDFILKITYQNMTDWR